MNQKHQILNNTIYFSFLGVFLFVVSLLFAPLPASAACASVPLTGDYVVDTSCTFSAISGVFGVDDGKITINTDRTLTVNDGQTIVWGPDKSVVINGTIAINNGGQLKQTRIWVKDSDRDGYATADTPIAQTGSPGADYVYRSQLDVSMTNTTDLAYDYDDNSTSTYPGTICDGNCTINNTDGLCGFVATGTDPLNNCTGAYTCSGFTTRLINMCNGFGGCADIDEAATDCSGTCSSYCNLGSCTSTDTQAGTCMEGTNTRVASGGDGSCIGGTCVAPWACGDAITDSRDSKTYATVLIGSQCWLKQGLNIGTRISGWPDQQDNDSEIEKYCMNNIEANCTSNNHPNYPDGGLYTWAEAMALPFSCHDLDCSGQIQSPHQGICPAGWHIPSDVEFQTLEIYLGMCPTGEDCADDTGSRGTDEGTKLKPNGTSGFEFNIAGDHNGQGSFGNRDHSGYLWTADCAPGHDCHDRVFYRSLYDYLGGNPTVSRGWRTKPRSSTVRCLED